MFEQYIGCSIWRLLAYAGVMASAAVLTTVLYVQLYGFDKWKGDMITANDLMLAGTLLPLGETEPQQAQPQMFNPQQMPMQMHHQQQAPQMQHQQQQNGMAAGQFLCPQHGPVGMPIFSQAGTAHCPLCTQPMLFHGTQNTTQARAAAFPQR